MIVPLVVKTLRLWPKNIPKIRVSAVNGGDVGYNVSGRMVKEYDSTSFTILNRGKSPRPLPPVLVCILLKL